jgi:hypothetical protein
MEEDNKIIQISIRLSQKILEEKRLLFEDCTDNLNILAMELYKLADAESIDPTLLKYMSIAISGQVFGIYEIYKFLKEAFWTQHN